MRTLATGQALVVGNQQLVFHHALNGHLVDPVDLAFQVFRTATEEEQLAPVQVFPALAGTEMPVNLVTDKLGTGRFSAVGWTPADKGSHFIRWYWTSEAGGVEQHVDVPFDVQGFAIDPSVPFYASVSMAREAGVAACDASDARVVAALRRASQFIDSITGRFFEPRYISSFYDGRGSTALLFTHPIIAVDEVKVTTRPVRPSDQAIDKEFLRVYNRHLSGMTSPDDRNNPRVELFSMTEDWIGVRPFSFSRLVFPKAQQNVSVSGVFGYTDPDGSPFGRTPHDIEHVALLLMLRNIPGLLSQERQDAILQGRLKSESTRDQSYELLTAKDLGLAANITGDPEIDQVLARYMRPPTFGSA
jgi:hypothetical protein